MTSHILLVLGVAVMSLALRSFRNPILFRIGTLGVVVTSFLAGWLLGNNLLLGFLFASTWLFLPWVEILTRVRRMRLPLDRILESRTPPSRNVFPGFADITEEIEEAGYEYVDDTGWNFENNRQFYRLFYHTPTRTQAAICLVEQSEFSFYYVTVTSRGTDGRSFMTWNYPFSYGLRLVPGLILNRIAGEMSFSEILSLHTTFLAAHQVSADSLAGQTPEAMRTGLQSDLRAQLVHNMDVGLLMHDGPDFIRYTTRGMIYLWLQFLRDLVRFS